MPSLDEIPGPVDLVLLGVHDSVLEAGAANVPPREATGPLYLGSAHEPGSARDRRCATGSPTSPVQAGIALCGGGCMGFVNVAYGLRAIGYLEPDPLPQGSIAFVSHSGSVFSAFLRNNRGLGFTLAVSAGQELVTSTASYLDYALDLPGTRIVAVLLETLATRVSSVEPLPALPNRVPVVALTVGGSKPGRAMVAAHSGALAGDDGAWEALFDAYGVIRVWDLDEMTDTLELFASGRRAPRSLPDWRDSDGARFRGRTCPGRRHR